MKTYIKPQKIKPDYPSYKEKEVYHCWCVTYYPKDTTEGISYINSRLLNSYFRESCQFAVFGFEHTSYDRLHLQGYVFMKEPRSKFTMTRLLPDAGYLEPAINTPDSNFRYCTKENNFIYYGYLTSAEEQWNWLKKLDFDRVCLL